MKKKIRIGIIIIILLIVAIVGTVYLVKWIEYDNSQKVEFEDEEMGKVIAATAEIGDVIKFRKSDFEKIDDLNIGYTGYYTTLVDIEKCYNLKQLTIGQPDTPFLDYPFKEREVPENESPERIEQIQEELGSVLENCKNLQYLTISNKEGNCPLNSLNFLYSGEQLKDIMLYYQEKVDYTPIWECQQLTGLSLSFCDISELDGISKLNQLTALDVIKTNISEAGDIVNLPNLEYLSILDTPLEKNEEEIALLYEALPDLYFAK